MKSLSSRAASNSSFRHWAQLFPTQRLIVSRIRRQVHQALESPRRRPITNDFAAECHTDWSYAPETPSFRSNPGILGLRQQCLPRPLSAIVRDIFLPVSLNWFHIHWCNFSCFLNHNSVQSRFIFYSLACRKRLRLPSRFHQSPILFSQKALLKSWQLSNLPQACVLCCYHFPLEHCASYLPTVEPTSFRSWTIA